jgi:nanoRNase/pAp phosphatase (c-di-AMP/oligoRNAs hydrolase)
MSATIEEEKKSQKKTIAKLNPFEKWYDSIVSNKVEKVSIVVHDNPDPDALASALAAHKILDKVGIESEIFWGGDIDHTQNKKFINITGINTLMTRINGEKNERIENRFRDHPILVVDTSCKPGTGNLRFITNFIDPDRKIDMVIDHHDNQTIDPVYYYNEPWGSCAAIFCDILVKLKIFPKLDPAIATALYFGIEKDTDGLKHESTTDQDREYYSKLKTKIDENLYYEIIHFKYPVEKLEVDQKCHKFMNYEAGIIVCGAGFIIAQKKSFLASVADDIIGKYENVNLVCVLGISYEDGVPSSEKLVVSVRNNGHTIDTGDFMKQTFGEGFGGRKGAGGGASPIGIDLCLAIEAIQNDEVKKDELFMSIFSGWKKRILAAYKKMG